MEASKVIIRGVLRVGQPWLHMSKLNIPVNQNEDVTNPMMWNIPEHFRELSLGELFLGEYLEDRGQIVVCAGLVVHWGQLGDGDDVGAVREEEVGRGEAGSVLEIQFSKRIKAMLLQNNLESNGRGHQLPLDDCGHCGVILAWELSLQTIGKTEQNL